MRAVLSSLPLDLTQQLFQMLVGASLHLSPHKCVFTGAKVCGVKSFYKSTRKDSSVD